MGHGAWHKRSRLFSGCVIGVASLLVAVLTLVIVFVVNNQPPNIKVPTPKMPKVNGWDDFVRATTIVSNVKETRRGPLDETNMSPLKAVKVKDYTAFVRAAQPVNEAVKIGLAKPCLRPAVRSFHPFSTKLIDEAYLREVARVLAGEALCYDEIGQTEQAIRLLLDCIEFGVTLPRGADFSGSSAGLSAQSIGAHYLGLMIPRLSSDELAYVANRLERINKKHVPFSDLILEEGRSSTAINAEIFCNPKAARLMRDPRNIVGSNPVTCLDPSSPKTVLGDISYALSNKQALLMANLRYFEALAKEQKAPYSTKSSIPVSKNPFTESTFQLIELVVDKPGIIAMRAYYTKPQAVLALLQTEVALRRFKIDNGNYPDRLSQLVPKYLKSRPVDPFANGKPLHYRKTGKTYLLFSLGPDMRDNGGKPGPKTWPGLSNSTDIVAGKCY